MEWCQDVFALCLGIRGYALVEDRPEINSDYRRGYALTLQASRDLADMQISFVLDPLLTYLTKKKGGYS